MMYGNQMASKLHSYRRMNLETRSGPELLLAVCDGALNSVEIAIESDDRRVRLDELSRARRIVLALQENLSIDTGGVVAINLFRHYTYLSRLLLEAQQDPMAADLTLVRAKLVELCDTWSEAVDLYLEEANGAARAS